MPTYYVWSGGSNTAPYDTMAKAAQDPNTIEAIPVAAGDTMRMRGTFTGTWTWAVSGTNTTTGAITCIGVDDSDVAYAAQYTVDRNGGGNNAVNCAGYDYRNVHCISGLNATNDGWLGVGTSYCLFEKCISDTSGRYGIYISGAGNYYLNCIVRNGSNNGWHGIIGSVLDACYAYNNTGAGIYSTGSVHITNSGAYDNDADNIYLNGVDCNVENTFCHGSSAGSGIRCSVTSYVKIFGCSLTSNNQYGIEVAAGNSTVHEDYNGFLSNGVGLRSNCPTGRHSGTFSASPYVNAGAGNFSTSDTADFRRTEIDMEFA